jgi:hypothetical protein
MQFETILYEKGQSRSSPSTAKRRWLDQQPDLLRDVAGSADFRDDRELRVAS